MMTSTYSPEDNKLRLYSSTRLDAETYRRVKAAGLAWAPKQGLFVAPMWTPDRADLLTELCGEIGDEDTSLVDRAEERAERFGYYSARRAEDAAVAKANVDKIADGIPLGQPILIGHHSERHARKDAEKIENGMRRAIKMWETSQYWQSRAAAAVRSAKYKERPDVRARRIKTLESEQRKETKIVEECRACVENWEKVLTQPEDVRRQHALYIANYSRQTPCDTWSDLDQNKITPEQAAERSIATCTRQIARAERWLQHVGFRLDYERAKLSASGGTVTDRKGPENGGACKCWASHRGGWSYIQKVNKVSVTVLDNWGNGGGNFTRAIPFDKLGTVMTAAEVRAARDNGTLIEADDKTGFFLTDAPAPAPTPEPAPEKE